MKYVMFLIFVLLVFVANGQTCLHTDLSKKYNYKVFCIGNTENDEVVKNCHVTLVVISKRNNTVIQKINFKAVCLYDTVYKDCNYVRSYSTGKNEHKEVLDYDFGDLIIADLNFDGKEDIAIKSDSGGNGGPIYNFYFQDDSGKFKISHFLTDHIISFPKYINKKSRTLTTQIHANAYQEGRKSFKYYPKTKKWKLVEWVMVNS